MERTLRIVFAGGGTGGHLFPALAVADELRRRHPEADIRFIGARRGLERRLVPRAGYPLLALRLSGIQGRGRAGRLLAGAAAGWAVLHCLACLSVRRPGLVIGVGGYASGPAVLAARLLGIKTMIMEQNHFPGATNRWLAPRVDLVCVPSEEARRRLGGRGLVTGNPVRPQFAAIGEPPGAGDLSLLVFGGSRGARSINEAVTGALGRLAAMAPPPRIVHQTGAEDEASVREAYGGYPEGRWEVLPFIENMPARLAAADLVVCRAGATTLAEITVAGRPAILVPYPHAADDHQRHNAETLQASGAAVVVRDDELDGGRLAERIEELASSPEKRSAMGRAARRLARPDAARSIADAAEALIREEPAARGDDVS